MKNSLHVIKINNKVKITIATQEDIGSNLLIFTDTGVGIPDDVLPHIFDPFFTANKKEGTGIGLAFCKNVMKAIGGTIHCDSDLGRYTAFTLKFPMPNALSALNLKKSIHAI
jgi:signal transduction histidine kinase